MSENRSLTPIEARIGHLVAAGRTNREAAVLLGLSPKTVEWHLSRIYRKEGVRSRTELALRLAGGSGGRGNPLGPGAAEVEPSDPLRPGRPRASTAPEERVGLDGRASVSEVGSRWSRARKQGRGT